MSLFEGLFLFQRHATDFGSQHFLYKLQLWDFDLPLNSLYCRWGCFGHRAILLILCLLFGNVTWEVDVEDKEERDEGGTLMCKQRGWRWMRVRHHGWHGDETICLQRQHDLEPIKWSWVTWDNCAHTTVLKQNKHTMNWSDKHVLLKWKDRHALLTWKRTRELETAYVLVLAGNLKFRFQHGPFTKRFGPVVTRVPAVVLSTSRFSRLAVTRAFDFLKRS